MKTVKALIFSLFILIMVALAAFAVGAAFRMALMGIPKEARPLERVIIYTETGTRLFELDSWRSKGSTGLDGLFSGPVLEILNEHKYEIEMAVDRFDETTARAVKRLNKAGVTVWVWPLHSIEDGYWLSADNAPLFPALYERFKAWTRDYGLSVHGVMLDMEPSYDDVQVMAKKARDGGMIGGLAHLLGRRDRALNEKAFAVYAGAVARMKADGFAVSTFDIPYVLDDWRDGDRSLQEMFHVVHVPADIASFMLYRSYFRDSGLGTGAANVAAYAVSLEGRSAGIGDYMNDDISLADFRNDLRLAARYSPVVHIYNLEGLVSRGWLDEIAATDLSLPVEIGLPDKLPIAAQRTFFFAIDLASGKSLWYALPGIVLLWAAIFIWQYCRAKIRAL